MIKQINRINRHDLLLEAYKRQKQKFIIPSRPNKIKSDISNSIIYTNSDFEIKPKVKQISIFNNMLVKPNFFTFRCAEVFVSFFNFRHILLYGIPFYSLLLFMIMPKWLEFDSMNNWFIFETNDYTEVLAIYLYSEFFVLFCICCMVLLIVFIGLINILKINNFK